MNIVDLIGFIGVFLILLAFFLNLINTVSNKSPLYLALNFIGAGTACLASVLLNYIPFIILEGIWALVSLWGLVRLYHKKRPDFHQTL